MAEDHRVERDSIGKVQVPADKLWGAQTQRSRDNFKIGTEQMPMAVVRALAVVKQGAAAANKRLGRLDEKLHQAIEQACEEVQRGQWDEHFPLVVWQTGSGTQSNMNVNEVIAHRANQLLGQALVHPIDHVNKSQSSNDTFPSAMHIAAVTEIETRLLPAVAEFKATLAQLEQHSQGIIKIGRTHLQDAVPIAWAQEISAWREMLIRAEVNIKQSLAGLRELALGGTAVGTGLNAPTEFAQLAVQKISSLLGTEFLPATNKFHALTSRDAMVFAHGALQALAADLMKIANDIRWYASGPRCGLGEISIPKNEPGSSIMPGKVNPTQSEALTMVTVQVMANNTAIAFGASQGNFQLNVFMPLCIYNFLQSVRLLADGMISFDENCLAGLRPNIERMEENLDKSLMLVTALTPHIGYDRAAEIARLAEAKGIRLKDAAVELGYLNETEFEQLVRPQDMV